MADTINNPPISWLTNLPPTGAPSRALHLGPSVVIGKVWTVIFPVVSEPKPNTVTCSSKPDWNSSRLPLRRHHSASLKLRLHKTDRVPPLDFRYFPIREYRKSRDTQ